MGLLDTKTLGFLSDLIAQHVYIDGTPQTMRRRWNLSGFSVSDDSANEWLDITVGEDTLTDDGDAALTIAYSGGAVTGDAIGVDINETAAPTGDSILLRLRRNATNVLRVLADASSYAVLDSPTQIAMSIATVTKLTFTATLAEFTVPAMVPNNNAFQSKTTGDATRDLIKLDGSDEVVIGNGTQQSNLDALSRIDLRLGGTPANKLSILSTEARFTGVNVAPNYSSGNSATAGAIRMQRGDWIAFGSSNRNALTVNTSDEVVIGDSSVAGIELGHATVQFDQALVNPVIRVQSSTTANGTSLGLIGQTTSFTNGNGGVGYIQGGDGNGTGTNGEAQMRSSAGTPRFIVDTTGQPITRHGTSSGDSNRETSDEDGALIEHKFFPPRVDTSDATITQIFSFDVDDDKVYTYDIIVTVRSRDDGDSGTFREMGGIEGTSGTAAIVGGNTAFSLAQDAGWGTALAAFVVVEVSSNTLRVRVEGKAGDDLVWQCRAVITEGTEVA